MTRSTALIIEGAYVYAANAKRVAAELAPLGFELVRVPGRHVRYIAAAAPGSTGLALASADVAAAVLA